MNKHYKPIVKTTDIDREEWLRYRASGLGGSDAGTIAGVNPYKSAFALWAEKSGRVEDSFEGNAATELGNLFELPVAKAFARQTGAHVVAWPVMLQSLERPWQLANVDFFIMPNEGDYDNHYPAGEVTVVDHLAFEPEAILEIKTTGLAGRGNAQAWRNGGVPKSYEYQGLHYSCVTGIDKVIFCALVGGEGLVIRERQFDEIQRGNLNVLEAEFWEQVQNGEAPDLEGKESDFDVLKSLYPKHVPEKIVEADEFQADLVAEYLRAKKFADEAQEVVDKLKAQLIALAGDAEEVDFNGQTLFTYKASKDGETFDAKAFKEAHPDLAAQFTKIRAGYRTLRIKDAE